ncbi:MAG: hypothetical protein HY860_06805 [Chlamydiales bacterium]|nr:hypothetical protein [Chlamydiales bacterium]
MNDKFLIYIDRLIQGKKDNLSFEVPPSFLEINEDDLSFEDTVFIEMESYIAEDHLILHLDLSTTCTIPCGLCNQKTRKEISLNGEYYTIPLKEIPSRVYNFKEAIRESILLEVPSYYQCNDPNCPGKEELKKYLKQESVQASCPFADLDC